MSLLKNEGDLREWHDRDLGANQEWKHPIDQRSENGALDSAADQPGLYGLALLLLDQNVTGPGAAKRQQGTVAKKPPGADQGEASRNEYDRQGRQARGGAKRGHGAILAPKF